MIPDPGQDFGSQLIEWKHSVGKSRLSHKSGHPPDHRARLILDQDVAAGFIDALATAKAVLSHACHHHGQHV